MYRNILPVLIFGSFIITYADSAVQTDWSGGSGVPGPVIDWSDQFNIDFDIDWGSIPGDILLQLILEHTVDEDFDAAKSVYSEDIDGDGDMDVLGAAYYDDDITWWENIDGSGTSWIEHIVDGDFNGARSVYSEDIDGDGDMDILGAAGLADDITWWENIDGSGTSWAEHTIDGYVAQANSVYSEDIDGDGDLDVLGVALAHDDIIWWENVDGTGTNWIKHIIDEDFDYANSVYSEDINGDGDMDVLGAATYADDITWWENEDGSGTSWIEHTVDGDFWDPVCVFSEDINGDGDMDVLGVSNSWDDITWWENIDGLGTIWTMHTIDGNFNGARSVYSEDIDGDGDLDVLGAAYHGDDIIWWENIDGSGTSWIEHIVDDNFNGAWSVYSEDIDGDGNMDILGAGYFVDRITWWDITKYYPSGLLQSSILDIQGNPDWDYLDWNSQTPPGTSISFQVRASDNYNYMGVWSGPLTSPCLLEGILNDGDKYVQYMTILETSNPYTTPTLNDVIITWDPLVGVEDTAEPIPLGTELLPFAPNPVAGLPVIRFGLPEHASVDISIFDMSGHMISEINGDEYTQGYHDVLVGDLSPGIYICRMISGDFTAAQRFVVIK